MTNLKGVLARASSHSDSGDSKDWPPTYQDVQMRAKHTSDSVEYNLDHAEDHLSELVSQLSKLCGVDRGKAETLAQKVCNYLDKVYKEVETYKGNAGKNLNE